jgi:FKBP-type peptidyl-prolyl cis-trans isomerase SlyD
MKITKNSVVSIEYILTNDKNQVLDSNVGETPLDYLHGHKNIIPGLEKALEGKSKGDKFSVHIPAKDAYGLRDDGNIIEVPRKELAEEHIEEGMQFYARSPQGNQTMTVISVNDNTVILDGNHPLAGIDLNFDITVLDLREADEEEIQHGHLHDCCCGSAHGCTDGCADGCTDGCACH